MSNEKKITVTGGAGGNRKKKSIVDEVAESLAGKVYKYKNPKTGQIFEYDRVGLYRDEDGTFLVRV